MEAIEGKEGLAKKFEKFISALPPPVNTRIPAPADVADNNLALTAARGATAFYFHLKTSLVRPPKLL